MSNYIVNSESIARIANLIKYANFNRWGLEVPSSVHYAFDYCKNNDGFFDEKALCRALAIENYIAVDHRYNRSSAPETIEAFYNEAINQLESTYIKAPIWLDGIRILGPEHYQAYKTLQCYLYQIDEDLTCKDGVYKSLKELENTMSHWIIANSEMYNSCKWE